MSSGLATRPAPAWPALHDRGPVSGRFIVLAVVVGVVLLAALYSGTLTAEPAGDDLGPPLTEIAVGNREGLGTLLGETRQPKNYRPLQSLLMWAAGRAAGVTDPAQPLAGPEAPAALWISIHALALLCGAALLATAGLVLRQLPIGRAGVITAIGVIVLHPSMAAAVGSIDGFSSLLAPAFVWLGLWAIIALRRRPAAGLAAAFACFLLGVGVKEYAFALWPTAAVAAAIFVQDPRGPHRRWLWAAAHGLLLGAATALVILGRRLVVPEGAEMPAPGVEMATIARNGVLVVLGGLFVGDSVWVFLSRSALALGTAAVTVAATTVLLAGGLWLRLGLGRRALEATGAARADPDRPAAWQWALFLVICAVTINFPANVLMPMSEMYLAAWIVALALLAGLAADGFSRYAGGNDHPGRASVVQRLALAAALGLAMLATASTWRKAGLIHESGTYSRAHLAAVVEHLPKDARDLDVMLVYRREDPRIRPTYSVYQVGDLFAMQSADLLEAVCPGRGLRVKSLVISGESGVEEARRQALQSSGGGPDLILLWDPPTKRYRRLAPVDQG